MKWLEENMVKEFPIGVFIDKGGRKNEILKKQSNKKILR